MPQPITPYDSGYRLEPHLWPTAGAEAADGYGRVDFENENGETVFTLYAQKTETGYIIRADDHLDVSLAFETRSDREARRAAMTHLDQELSAIGRAQPEGIHFANDWDPDAFAPGHYVFASGEYQLAITEQYVGTDSSDEDRVPNSWEYIAARLTLDGWHNSRVDVFDPNQIHDLIDAVKTWCQNRTNSAPH